MEQVRLNTAAHGADSLVDITAEEHADQTHTPRKEPQPNGVVLPVPDCGSSNHLDDGNDRFLLSPSLGDYRPRTNSEGSVYQLRPQSRYIIPSYLSPIIKKRNQRAASEPSAKGTTNSLLQQDSSTFLPQRASEIQVSNNNSNSQHPDDEITDIHTLRDRFKYPLHKTFTNNTEPTPGSSMTDDDEPDGVHTDGKNDSCDDDDTNDSPPGGASEEEWSSQLQYVAVCLCFTLGSANVLEFALMSCQLGGGAFVIPYILATVVLAIPLMYLESVFGQFTTLGPCAFTKVIPLFKGLCYTMLLLGCFSSLSSMGPLIWSATQLASSLYSPLPWGRCRTPQNQSNSTHLTMSLACCGEIFVLPQNFCINSDVISFNTSTMTSPCTICTTTAHVMENVTNTSLPDADAEFYLYYTCSVMNTRKMNTVLNNSVTFSSDSYFHEAILGYNQSEGPSITLPNVLSTFIVSCLLFFALLKRSISVKWVALTCCVLSSVLLVVITGRALVTSSSMDFMGVYLRPRWHHLADPKIWQSAFRMVLQIYGAGLGVMVTLGSSCRFHYDSYKVLLKVSFFTVLISICGGFLVSASLYGMSARYHTPISSLAETDLLFALHSIIPESLSQSSLPSLWLLLYFLMLTVLRFGRVMVLVYSVVTSLWELFLYSGFQFDRLMEPTGLVNGYVKTSACVVGMLMLTSFVFSSPVGVDVYVLLVDLICWWPQLCIILLELLVIVWLLGTDIIYRNIWLMSNRRIGGHWWRLMWKYVTPAIIVFVVVYHSLHYLDVQYNQCDISRTAHHVSWVFVVAMVIPIPILFFLTWIKLDVSFMKKWREGCYAQQGGWDAIWLATEGGITPIPDYIYSEVEICAPDMVSRRKSQQLSLSVFELAIGHSLQNTTTDDQIDTGSISWSEDENKERGNWSRRYDFLVAGVAYCVGVGNIWKFAYLVSSNGGGTFFVPYFVMLIFCGIPLFSMEVVMGQYASLGALSVWRAIPLAKGIGYASCIYVFLVCVHQGVVNAWTIYYIFASMNKRLPWANCDNDWNTEACRPRSSSDVMNFSTVLECGSAILTTEDYTSGPLDHTITSTTEESCGTGNVTNSTNTMFTLTPENEFFFYKVLNTSPQIDIYGPFQKYLVLCLGLFWIFVFLVLLKGVKSMGRVAYFSLPVVYMIMLTLFVRCITCGSGHMDGLGHYIRPDWSILLQPRVWGNAATHMFLSLGLSTGCFTSLSSYNRFHYSCFRDVYVICWVDSLTNAFAGFFVFCILGYLAHEVGIEVHEIVATEYNFAFLIFPEAVNYMPGASVWAALFYLMMLLLALNNQFLMVGSLIIAIMDVVPERWSKKRIWITAAICLLMMLLGVLLLARNGIYLMVIFDKFLYAWIPTVLGFLTAVAISWLYGMQRFTNNVHATTGEHPSTYWKLVWKYIMPTVLLFVCIYTWASFKGPTFISPLPMWATVVPACISIAPLLAIPTCVIIQLMTTHGSWVKRWKISVHPVKEWGPALIKHQLFTESLPHYGAESESHPSDDNNTIGTGLFATLASGSFLLAPPPQSARRHSLGHHPSTGSPVDPISRIKHHHRQTSACSAKIQNRKMGKRKSISTTSAGSQTLTAPHTPSMSSLSAEVFVSASTTARTTNSQNSSASAEFRSASLNSSSSVLNDNENDEERIHLHDHIERLSTVSLSDVFALDGMDNDAFEDTSQDFVVDKEISGGSDDGILDTRV